MGTDRYEFLIRSDGTMQNLPKVKISGRDTDKFVVYDSARTRLDRISAEIYDDDTYGWLILLANPEFFIEFDIPSGTVVRIPFPLQDVLTEYQTKVISKKDK
jgi:hypothetical protein